MSDETTEYAVSLGKVSNRFVKALRWELEEGNFVDLSVDLKIRKGFLSSQVAITAYGTSYDMKRLGDTINRLLRHYY